MDKGTKIKLTLCTFLFVAIFFAGMILPCFITQSVYGPLVGIFVSIVVITIIMIRFYPIWFKDYIEEFYRQQEANE